MGLLLRGSKSSEQTSIDFGQNTKNGIPTNSSRIINIILTHITSLESGTGIGRNSDVGRNGGNGIPPINIGSFGIFDRGASDFSDRSALWHGAAKSESENSGNNSIFKNVELENNFEVEAFGRKNDVILNYVTSTPTHINQITWIQITLIRIN